MTINRTKLTLAAVLFGILTLPSCTTPPGSNTSPGLYDPSSNNAESVPYDAWFKDRPQ